MKPKRPQKSDFPEYVIQPNVISQAIYSVSANARRLIAMAMSLLPEKTEKPEDYRVSFSVADFTKALGIDNNQSGTQKKYILAAVRECLDSHIEITMPNGNWKGWTWFVESCLEYEILRGPEGNEKDLVPIDDNPYADSCWNNIIMEFNPKLGAVIKEFKKAYAKLNLVDLGKLQSRYAIRFYELALSYAGFAGKDGNRPGEWYFEKSLEDIRILFGVDAKKYKVTKDFRVRVIDNPIEEINAANIGLRIEPDYIRRGKRLMGARFICRWIKKGEPRPVHPATKTGQEEDRLITDFPEEYKALYEKHLAKLQAQPGLFRDYPHFQEAAAKSSAVEELFQSKRPGKKGAAITV